MAHRKHSSNRPPVTPIEVLEPRMPPLGPVSHDPYEISSGQPFVISLPCGSSLDEDYTYALDPGAVLLRVSPGLLALALAAHFHLVPNPKRAGAAGGGGGGGPLDDDDDEGGAGGGAGGAGRPKTIAKYIQLPMASDVGVPPFTVFMECVRATTGQRLGYRVYIIPTATFDVGVETELVMCLTAFHGAGLDHMSRSRFFHNGEEDLVSRDLRNIAHSLWELACPSFFRAVDGQPGPVIDDGRGIARMTAALDAAYRNRRGEVVGDARSYPAQALSGLVSAHFKPQLSDHIFEVIAARYGLVVRPDQARCATYFNIRANAYVAVRFPGSLVAEDIWEIISLQPFLPPANKGFLIPGTSRNPFVFAVADILDIPAPRQTPREFLEAWTRMGTLNRPTADDTFLRILSSVLDISLCEMDAARRLHAAGKGAALPLLRTCAADALDAALTGFDRLSPAQRRISEELMQLERDQPIGGPFIPAELERAMVDDPTLTSLSQYTASEFAIAHEVVNVVNHHALYHLLHLIVLAAEDVSMRSAVLNIVILLAGDPEAGKSWVMEWWERALVPGTVSSAVFTTYKANTGGGNHGGITLVQHEAQSEVFSPERDELLKAQVTSGWGKSREMGYSGDGARATLETFRIHYGSTMLATNRGSAALSPGVASRVIYCRVSNDAQVPGLETPMLRPEEAPPSVQAARAIAIRRYQIEQIMVSYTMMCITTGALPEITTEHYDMYMAMLCKKFEGFGLRKPSTRDQQRYLKLARVLCIVDAVNQLFFWPAAMFRRRAFSRLLFRRYMAPLLVLTSEHAAQVVALLEWQLRDPVQIAVDEAFHTITRYTPDARRYFSYTRDLNDQPDYNYAILMHALPGVPRDLDGLLEQLVETIMADPKNARLSHTSVTGYIKHLATTAKMTVSPAYDHNKFDHAAPKTARPVLTLDRDGHLIVLQAMLCRKLAAASITGIIESTVHTGLKMETWALPISIPGFRQLCETIPRAPSGPDPILHRIGIATGGIAALASIVATEVPADADLVQKLTNILWQPRVKLGNPHLMHYVLARLEGTTPLPPPINLQVLAARRAKAAGTTLGVMSKENISALFTAVKGDYTTRTYADPFIYPYSYAKEITSKRLPVVDVHTPAAQNIIRAYNDLVGCQRCAIRKVQGGVGATIVSGASLVEAVHREAREAGPLLEIDALLMELSRLIIG